MVGPRTGKPKGTTRTKIVPPKAAVLAPAAKAIDAKPDEPKAPALSLPRIKAQAPRAAKPVPAPVPVAPPIAKAAIEAPVKIAETLSEALAKTIEASAEVVPVEVRSEVIEEAAASPAAAIPPVSTPPAAKPLQKGLSAMVETITSKPFAATPESVQTMFGDLSARAKTAMEHGAKMAEEMGEFAKGNVEAMMTSSRVAAKGAETLGQEAAAYSKKSLETATSAFKGFAAAKSPTELFKLQSDYARSSFDAAVAESSKFSEAMMKLFGEITQPISTRVAIAAEKIKTPAF